MTKGTGSKPTVYGTSFVADRKPNFPERLVLGPLADPIWDGYAKSVAYVNALSDKKLWRLREAVDALGTTNCGWLTFRMKHVFLELIEWEIKHREEVAQPGFCKSQPTKGFQAGCLCPSCTEERHRRKP